VPVQCLTGQMLTQRDDHKRALRTAPHHRPQLRRPESKCAANQRVSHTAFLVHNHPSGDPTPSRADIEMTRDHGGGAPARHCRARPHHRRQRRARQPEGAEADLMSSIAPPAIRQSTREIRLLGRSLLTSHRPSAHGSPRGLPHEVRRTLERCCTVPDDLSGSAASCCARAIVEY
jgi:RadC-like JAB domain